MMRRICPICGNEIKEPSASGKVRIHITLNQNGRDKELKVIENLGGEQNAFVDNEWIGKVLSKHILER